LGAIANICGLVLIVRGELRRRDLEWRHVLGKARRLIAYSMPMLISTVLVFLNQYIDRAIVAKYLGASELGGYAIGVKMAGLFLLVLKPLKMALTPYVFAAAKQDSIPRGFVAIYYAYLAGTLAAFPFAYFTSPYVWR
ncbi:oligosaccharide flippase family protein, partial [Stenotrophomonas maltophilia group sp. RNC7]